jgi:1,4-dihydroxy-2-naphthoyl-CoA synthase
MSLKDTMSFRNLTIERDGAVSKLTLHRAEVLNAFSEPLLEEFLAAVEEIGENGSRALVITGAGRARTSRTFCRRMPGSSSRNSTILSSSACWRCRCPLSRQ